MSTTACPDQQTLSSYAVGNVPTAELEEIASHLDGCTGCQSLLENLQVPADSLLAELRRPFGRDEFGAEPELQQALQVIRRLCPLPAEAMPEEADLGSLREYRLLRQIGQGGMGTVYEALHTHLNRIVALKLLPAERMTNAQAVARFRNEMRAVGQLDHPSVVRAFDAGEHDGTHYLVMEFVEGTDLSTLSRRCGPLPVAEACELARQTAEGLQAVHEYGLVHRDVKPANLLLTADGRVKILDLGLALLRDDRPVGEELTTTGQLMGTLDYIAPEQARDTHRVDIRADLYSLGCTLYKLLAGQPPFQIPGCKSPFEKMLAHTQEPPPPIQERSPDVPDGLARVLDRLLAKAPADRFATPLEAARALEPFTADADLKGLLDRAAAADEPETKTDRPSTASAISSSLTDTFVPQPAPEFAEAPPAVGRISNPSDSNTVGRISNPSDSNTDGLKIRPTGRRRRSLLPAAAVALALLAAGGWFLAGIVLKVETPAGMIVLEYDQPELEGAVVSVDGKKQITITTAGAAQPTIVSADAGKRLLQVTRGGFKTFTEEFEIEAGKERRIRVRLEPLAVGKTVPEAMAADAHETHVPTPVPTAGQVASAAPSPAEETGPWPTPAQQAFVDAVSQLKPAAQVAAVTDKLREVNRGGVTGMTLALDPQIENDLLVGLVIRDRGRGHETDLWPVAALAHLRSLDALITPATDLVPLATLPLEELRSVAITAFHPRAQALVEAFPRVQTINAATVENWLARREEIQELRKKLPDLPPEQQLAAVVEKLVEYNPGFDGTLNHHIANGRVISIELPRNKPEIVDLSPLHALPLIGRLECRYTRISDLSPLEGMPLSHLNCEQTRISDLAPLEGMPLRYLHFSTTPVSDLSPLEGMPLNELNCRYTLISDLSPLKGMLLTEFQCMATRVSDLSPLKGMPLIHLSCPATRVSDLSPLKGMPLIRLSCGGTRISDLSPLAGMPLESLTISNTPVQDLSPLQGMPLKSLLMANTPIDDLSALQGMPLEVLSLLDTAVIDLTPVQDCPLRAINSYGCYGLDAQALLALKDAPLRGLGYDLLLFHEEDEQTVRMFPLEVIPSGSVIGHSGPIDAFWQEVAERREAAERFAERLAELDAGKQIEAVRERLRELNPHFGGQQLAGRMRDGQIHSLHLSIDGVTDLTPLRALPQLRAVTLTNQNALKAGSLYDLSPLNSLPLEELNCDERLVRRNRAVLKGMPTLQTINGDPAKTALERLEP